MNIKNKTVLITGGGSGIGHEIAKLLSAANNKVIIVGRTLDKLKKVEASLPNVEAIVCDVTDVNAVNALVKNIEENYSDLSVLINNAGRAFKYTHGESANAYEHASQEFELNYLSVVRLTELLLPVLKKQTEAAVVNVTSIVALSPAIVIPTYSDSKAALRSYTLSLRKILEETSDIKVFELLPPMVNTDFAKEIGGEVNGIPPADVAEALISGLENEELEITVGKTTAFAEGFFPQRLAAFAALNSN